LPTDRLTVAEMKDCAIACARVARVSRGQNTLARIAARAAGREELVGLLVGPTAITLVPASGGRGQDPVRLRPHIAQARTARRLSDGEALGRRQRQAARDAAPREQLLQIW